MINCTVDGCSREVYYKKLQYCRRCYDLWRRHGDPTISVRIRDSGTPYERLMARVTVDENGCLIVSGPLTKNGYSRIEGKGGDYGHRIAWVFRHGPIPAGLTVDHLCRVRNCVNVEHMELVPQPVNTSRANRPDQTKCKSGRHDWIPENLSKKVRADGRVEHKCRICFNEYQRTRYAAQKAAAA